MLLQILALSLKYKFFQHCSYNFFFSIRSSNAEAVNTSNIASGVSPCTYSLIDMFTFMHKRILDTHSSSLDITEFRIYTKKIIPWRDRGTNPSQACYRQ